LLEAWLTRVNYAQSAEIGLKTPFLVIASDAEKRKIVRNIQYQGISPEEMSVNSRFSAPC
jgi:hypothetical protein